MVAMVKPIIKADYNFRDLMKIFISSIQEKCYLKDSKNKVAAENQIK